LIGVCVHLTGVDGCETVEGRKLATDDHLAKTIAARAIEECRVEIGEVKRNVVNNSNRRHATFDFPRTEH
jgi:hypothetical protein